MNLGPFLVTMDTHGNTLYEEVEKKAAMQEILKSLGG
jgi:tartrate dehydratase beta subunit/fumarate hydratase class I family protein